MNENIDVLHFVESLPVWARLFKTTMSLVNASLKFQPLISRSNICQYVLLKNVRRFCIEKLSLIFQQNISVYGYEVIKHLTRCSLNELVKLTML